MLADYIIFPPQLQEWGGSLPLCQFGRRKPGAPHFRSATHLDWGLRQTSEVSVLVKSRKW